MKTSRFLALIGLCLLMTMSVSAQRGGPGGGPGGAPGGFRGGGPPGGGPPGGGPGGFRGGGDRGSRGGFDPSGFLTRLDTNGNGVLDPNEQQGPAQFMITRLQQADPSIKPGQPISIKKATEAFTRAREQRDSGAGNDPRASRGGNSAADKALETELLVPGFGLEEEPIPLMGFGATAEMLAVVVTDADKREAAERMGRYDRNRDGFLTKDELSSRFAGNPMDFDRNKDGKLSEKELAVRYARRREGEAAAKEQQRDDERRRDRRGKDEPVDVYGGRKSYRNMAGAKLPSGLPGFFNDKDVNEDGQVTMAEYSSKWDDELIAEYFQFDLNSDGVITAREAAQGVESGASASLASSTTSARPESSTSSSPDRTDGSKPAPASSGDSTTIDSRNVKYAERIISRYDKNKDQALTASEWETMLINPSPADGNRDGRVTVNEYAMWMQMRSKK